MDEYVGGWVGGWVSYGPSNEEESCGWGWVFLLVSSSSSSSSLVVAVVKVMVWWGERRAFPPPPPPPEVRGGVGWVVELGREEREEVVEETEREALAFSQISQLSA